MLQLLGLNGGKTHLVRVTNLDECSYSFDIVIVGPVGAAV